MLRAVGAVLSGVALLGCGLGFASSEGSEATATGTSSNTGGVGGTTTSGGSAVDGGGGTGGEGGDGAGGMPLLPCQATNGASHFTDDFENETLSPEWMVVGLNANLLVGEAGGVGFINYPTTTDALGVYSVDRYTLVDCQVSLEVVETPNLQLDLSAWLAISAVTGEWASITLLPQDQIRFMAYDGVAPIGQSFQDYEATQHKWWRITEQSGMVHLQSSGDGGTWTTAMSFAAAPWISDIAIEWGTDSNTTQTDGSSFKIDNLNLSPCRHGLVHECP